MCGPGARSVTGASGVEGIILPLAAPGLLRRAGRHQVRRGAERQFSPGVRAAGVPDADQGSSVFCPELPLSTAGLGSSVVCPGRAISTAGPGSTVVCPGLPHSAGTSGSSVVCPGQPAFATGPGSSIVCPGLPPAAGASGSSVVCPGLVFPTTGPGSSVVCPGQAISSRDPGSSIVCPGLPPAAGASGSSVVCPRVGVVGPAGGTGLVPLSGAGLSSPAASGMASEGQAPFVQGLTPASTRGHLCFPLTVVGGRNQSVFPFVNVSMLNKLLEGYDTAKKRYLMDGFVFGFSLECDLSVSGDCGRNLSSCGMAPGQVDIYLAKEIGLGRVIGPYTAVPFDKWKISPVGLVPKASAGEYRVIHHLSYPCGDSVNDSIPRESVSVSYGSVDDAVWSIMERESVAYLAKCDLECAYRILPIRPEERGLLGFRWRDEIYFDCALPMGCSSSAAIFQRFSDALVWIAKEKFGCTSIINVLDDFLFIEDSESCGKLALGGFSKDD